MTTEDKPILLQGAMDIEIAYFLAKLKNKEKTVVNNFVFWQGDLPEGKVVISKTRIGTAMAAGATALGIHLYEPRLIISQGTSGAYSPHLGYNDIVLGEKFFNGSAVLSGVDGVNSFLALENMEKENDFARLFKTAPQYLSSNPTALKAAQKAAARYRDGKVITGVIASFDQWNKDVKKIRSFTEATEALCEEMETNGAGTIAINCGIPFLAVRVISNNNATGTSFKGETAINCQEFVEMILQEL